MVSKRIYVILVAALTLIFALTACGKATPTEDPALKITSIAATVQAEITQTALAMPTATPTLTPTATLSPATPTLQGPFSTATKSLNPGTGDNAKYDQDVTIPDGSIIKPGASFNKTWSIINSGITTWTTDYQLVYVFGPQATVMSVKLTKSVAPGEAIQITVPFVAPTVNGSYVSWWQMYSSTGFFFGDQVSVVFNVGSETATPTSLTPVPTTTGTPPTPTATP
ncbi:MAG: hypothetical protein CVU43_04185 [Chloroflexi bacterium HGW-Chloroflexi-5]|jgi:predicted small lipoprotein YifL|nr:MAG: hypothetical protein CVU43_04185 [Chloroflexi bacterium HGW-Chloroflexi-5]